MAPELHGSLALSSSFPWKSARGFNVDLWRIGTDCVVSIVSWFPYKLLMMKHQGLVITARSLSNDRELTFGFDGLPLVGVVFFLSSSLVGVVLFPSYAH